MIAAPVENFRLTAALSYAGFGWRVFPLHCPKMSASGNARCSCGKPDCTSVGKHPRTVAGLKEGTTDCEQIRRWWETWPDANVGVVTGAESGIVVLDVDPKNGGHESIAALMGEYGELPETVESRTGSGGAHIVFRHPQVKVGNSAGKLGPGLDIRGDGGYIVAAPSLHASGERYRWEVEPGRYGCAVLPKWMLGKLLVQPRAAVQAPAASSASDSCRHWLGKALADSTNGRRNEVGFRLACQLRDAGVSQSDAERTLLDYAARVPRGDEPYTDREAAASVRSAYSAAAREPARRPLPESPTLKAKTAKPSVDPISPADELKERLDGICDGRIFNVPFSFRATTNLTQALLPGTVTNIVGDPSIGKTFLVLQQFQFWHGNDFRAAVFFIEKDRVFHTLRLLAQLEGNGNLVDLDWVRAHRDEAIAAWHRHRGIIDELGKHIFSQPNDRVTLQSLLDWVRARCEDGYRVLVVDPLTAVSAGDQRWTKDEDFIIEAQSILTAHGASLILVTHAKKGNRPGSPTMHDIAGGAAYARFCDTSIWIQKIKKPRDVRFQGPHGIGHGKFHLFMQLHKTRNGRGGNQELAFEFGDGLKFAEQGIVLQDVDEQ